MFEPLLQDKVIKLLNKLIPIEPAQLSDYQFMLFGNGGFAKSIQREFRTNITGMIDYSSSISQRATENWGRKWHSPDEAFGTVVLGTGNGNYQFNQLRALAECAEPAIEKVLLVDPYLSLRGLEKPDPDNTILLLEHADGVERHAAHLTQLKRHFNKQGISTVSLCPLTLYHYRHYWRNKGLLMFNGQRPLYKIAKQIFSNQDITFAEYGFFPQRSYYYLDKKGTNHQCSLMEDDLTWIEDPHLNRVDDIRKSFLGNFKHVERRYILVPLQVPDDVNVVNCSRFTNGMQEFIDYIVEQYPQDQQILFKPHPKDPHRKTYNYRGKQHSDDDFIKLMAHACCVHGITSSTLYEAALAGVEVICEGESILAKHLHQKERLFAAMIDRQIHVSNAKPTYWLQKYSHLQFASSNE